MKTKRIAYALLLSSLLVGCTPSDAKLEEQGWVKDPANNGWVQNPADNGWVQNPANNGWVKDPATNGWVNNPAENGWVKDPATNGWVKDPANNGWVDADELTPSPTVEAEVVHWVPGADTANVTFKLDLKGATKLNVVLGGKLLKEFVDYEFEAGKLTILGAFLEDSGLGLGEHKGYVFTENGSAEIKIDIVARPDVEGSTIPMKSIQDVDLSKFGAVTINEPIAGAGDVFITEVNVDMGLYNYVEIFNNTKAEYNLKGHRVVWANLSKQDKGYFAENGLFSEPEGMSAATYIYQDFKIPALSSAIVWLVNTKPWTQTKKENGDLGGKIIEADNIQSLIIGENDANLNAKDFRQVYGLSDDVLVLPSRVNYGLINGTTGYTGDGWGTGVYKGTVWPSVDSSTTYRGIQLQKFTHEIFEETGTGKYFYYEMDVINREEDIYANGTFDADDLPTLLGFNHEEAVSTTNRQVIHALGVRKVYVTSATDPTPTGEVVSNKYDIYNADHAGWLEVLSSGCVKPLSTALTYPQVIKTVKPAEGETPETTTYTAAKWGETYEHFAIQYAAPVQGSIYSRVVPLEGERENLLQYFANTTSGTLKKYRDYYTAAIAPEVAGYGANSEVKVPVDPAYSTAYLANNHHSAGRVTALMLPAATA